MEAPRYATLPDYLRVLRRYRIQIVGIALLFAAAAYVYSNAQEPIYEAEASLSVARSDREFDALIAPATPILSGQDNPVLNARTASGAAVRRGAARRLGVSPESIAGKVSVRAEASTGFVVLTGRDRDPAFAARVTDAWALSAQEEFRRATRDRLESAAVALRLRLRRARGGGSELTRQLLVQRITQLDSLVDLARPAEIARSATVPSSPSSPRPGRDALLGLLLGLTTGMLLAFLRDALDQRVTDPDQVREDLSAPILAYLPKGALGRSPVADRGRDPLGTDELEPFRMLRLALELSGDPTVVAVTSARSEEGKSTVAAGLAVAYAAGGRDTVVLECDLRRPGLAETLGLDPGAGLADSLAAGSVDPRECELPLPYTAPGAGAGRLAVVPAGKATVDAALLLGSRGFDDVVARARERHGVVILDCPPILSAAEGREGPRGADAVVACARVGSGRRSDVRALARALDPLPGKLVGVVLTGVRHLVEAPPAPASTEPAPAA